MHRLTKKEKEIITTIIKYNAFTLKELQKILFIERGTVVTHLNNIYDKWQVHSKGEMVKHFYEQKLEKIRQICNCSKGQINCEQCPMCDECEELCVNDENLQDIILQIIDEVE